MTSEQLNLPWICYCCFQSWSSAIQSQFKELGQTHHNVKVISLTLFSPLWLTYWKERKPTGGNATSSSYCFRCWCLQKNLQSALTFHLQMVHTRKMVKNKASSHLNKPGFELLDHRKSLGLACTYVSGFMSLYVFILGNFFFLIVI